MRFLVGIFSGAVLLLLLTGEGPVTGAGGAFTRGVERVVPWLAERMRRPEPASTEHARTGDPVAEPTPQRATREAPLRGDSETQPDALVALWPDDAPLPEAFGDAYAWWARGGEEAASQEPRDPVDSPAPLSSAPKDQAARVTAAPDRVRQTTPAVAPETALVAGGASAVAPFDPATPRTASVWIPFHSERSAAGFAQRLARALEHPFDVRREGPGRYQVVFPYDDADRRDEVLARVAMLTGTQQ